jgi:hypothetical protein
MATTATIGASSRTAEYPPTSARKRIVATIVTDGTDGAAAGDIPATLFGLTFIESAYPAVKSDNTLLVALAPAYNGASLLGKAAATAAPADIPSGTYLLTVIGY